MTEKKGFLVREGEEVWESTTPSQVWMEIGLPDKTTKMITAHGVGARLRLQTADRQIYQERLERKEHDVFTNGLLVRVDADQQEDEDTTSPSAVTDEALMKLFNLKQIARFRNAIDELSEISLRRLVTLAKSSDIGTKQQEALKEMWDSKFGVNKDYVDPGNDIAATFPEQRLS